jgi:hypothetical protein
MPILFPRMFGEDLQDGLILDTQLGNMLDLRRSQCVLNNKIYGFMRH